METASDSEHKGMSDNEYTDMSDNEEIDSDAELQEAFAKGLLKPGLNFVEDKECPNKPEELKKKLEEFELKLDWIERLDLVNGKAPLAPELALKLQQQELEHEARINNLHDDNNRRRKKKKFIVDTENPALNEFRRETLFHRQAQEAVLIGIARLKELGIRTKRPDDYFAEMAKSDDHMHKIRTVLMKQKHSQEISEKVKKIRQLRKIGKQVQVEVKQKQAKEKKEMLEEVKKYRKGLRKDLDFLDQKKETAKSKRAIGKRKYRDERYGFGGKKSDKKRNTKDSVNDIGPKLRGNIRQPGHKKNPRKKQLRPGKNKRAQRKSKSRSK